MKKIRVAVIFGGTNTEHEVSIVSARSILQYLSPAKYEVIPIQISKDNLWTTQRQLDPGSKQLKSSKSSTTQLTTTAHELPMLDTIDDQKINIVFPVIHGPMGEDGTLQGMLEMAKVPYVGCGVLASAVCMDKPAQKAICQHYGIPTSPYYRFTQHQWETSQAECLKDCQRLCRYPMFVKPANQGSSVGVSKATDRPSLISAIEHALLYDIKIIVEEGVAHVREIECSVLGNDEPQASVLGEIVASNDFYDYDAKYVDGKSRAIIPADLPEKLSAEIRACALKAFQVLSCSGLARVDFLLDNVTNQFYLNELNTMPGFTSISMYPKLWQASGVSYSELLDKLIELALEKSAEKSAIHTSYTPKTDWYAQK
ncbi:D-alanine--D-alanine ligase A [Microgenomates group bacterium RIFCSPLOWO2_01_FULL_47_10]|nr:MAG: D-alanine--D-alanine ligase A [Microgenomates group bacterium RIFCSPLOWO2_01_FULL_47_10]